MVGVEHVTIKQWIVSGQCGTIMQSLSMYNTLLHMIQAAPPHQPNYTTPPPRPLNLTNPLNLTLWIHIGMLATHELSARVFVELGLTDWQTDSPDNWLRHILSFKPSHGLPLWNWFHRTGLDGCNTNYVKETKHTAKQSSNSVSKYSCKSPYKHYNIYTNLLW